MTKAEKDIYDFTKAKMENVLNVVNQLMEDEIESNKQHLISFLNF